MPPNPLPEDESHELNTVVVVNNPRTGSSLLKVDAMVEVGQKGRQAASKAKANDTAFRLEVTPIQRNSGRWPALNSQGLEISYG